MTIQNMLANLFLLVTLCSDWLAAVCFICAVCLLRRGNRRRQRTRLGILLLMASVGLAWLWSVFLQGGLIGRLVFCGVGIIAAWLIYRHLMQTKKEIHREKDHRND